MVFFLTSDQSRIRTGSRRSDDYVTWASHEPKRRCTSRMPNSGGCTVWTISRNPPALSRKFPNELVEEIRPRIQISRPVSSTPRSTRRSGGSISAAAELGVRLGQRVRHAKFGDGVILNCSGQGAHAQVEVNFETVGTKILVLAYANLDLM